MSDHPASFKSHEADELALYAVNDAQLYRSRILPIIANLKRKIKKGVYDPALALKLWKYAADDAAQRYTKEFDAPRRGGSSYGIFTVAQRMEVARVLQDHFEEHLREKDNPRGRFKGRPQDRGAWNVASRIAEIEQATIDGKDRAYLVSEVALRLNRGDLTGALSVAYQCAKVLFPGETVFKLDEAAKEIVWKIGKDYAPKSRDQMGRLLKRNPQLLILGNPRGRRGRDPLRLPSKAWLKKHVDEHGRLKPRIVAVRSKWGDEQTPFGPVRIVNTRTGAVLATLAGDASKALIRSTAQALADKLKKQVGIQREKKNPVDSRTGKYYKNQVRQTSCRHCGQDIENFFPYRAGEWRDRGNNTSCPYPARGKIHAPYIEKKNPAPRQPMFTPAGAPNPLSAAMRRFRRFTGMEPSRVSRVKLPRHRAGLDVGPVLHIAYETVRDGKQEKYIHRFAKKSRPHLVSSSDGSSLYLLGGAYRFTNRGIVDKKR